MVCDHRFWSWSHNYGGFVQNTWIPFGNVARIALGIVVRIALDTSGSHFEFWRYEQVGVFSQKINDKGGPQGVLSEFQLFIEASELIRRSCREVNGGPIAILFCAGFFIHSYESMQTIISVLLVLATRSCTGFNK